MQQVMQTRWKQNCFLNSEIEPILKKPKDLAFDSIMLELKLVDENEIKTASIILNKVSHSNSISISEETNILQVDDEPQGVEITSFLYNLLQSTKNWPVKLFRNLEWTWYIHRLGL